MAVRESGGERPCFELSEVRDDGTSRAEICSLRDVAGQVGDVALSRRSFWGISALVGGGLLAACAPAPAATPPPTPVTIADAPDCGQLRAAVNASALAISPDSMLVAVGRKLVTSGEAAVKLWSATDGALARSLFTPTHEFDGIGNLAFSPDGSLLAAINRQGVAYIWSVADGKLLRSANEGMSPDEKSAEERRSLAFSPDGQTLAVGSTLGSLKLYGVGNTSLPHILPVYSSRPLDALAFSPDGRTLAVGSTQMWSTADEPAIMLIDATTGKKLSAPDQANIVVETLAFSPDGATVAMGRTTGEVALWKPAKGSGVVTIKPPGTQYPAIWSLGYDSRGASLVFTRSDGNVFVADPASGAIRLVLSGHSGTGATFAAITPDGARAISVGQDGRLVLWDLESGRAIGTCSFDPATTNRDEKAFTYRVTDPAGASRTYSLPCGSARPAGAVCTCDCVPGRAGPAGGSSNPPSPNYPVPVPNPGGSGGGCTCNKVCTCVPVRKYCFVMWREGPLAHRSTVGGSGG